MERLGHRAAGGLMVAVLVALGASGSAAARPAHSRPPNPRIVQSLDSVVSAISALRVPGFVVGVSGGAAGNYERAVGMADVGANQPMTLSTHFRIGSISKTFTATVILKLIQDGRLRLSDRISRWEPQVPNARQITIKMLLNMTSGIWDEGGVGPQGQISSLGNFINQNCNKAPSAQCSQYFSPQQIVNLAIQDSSNVTHGAAYPPGVWYYADTNYVILGIIAQKVTGKPFGELLRKLVLRPLHLTQTSFPTRSLTLPSPAATGYKMDVNNKGKFLGYVPQQQPSPSILFGAGNVVSTLHDLRVWARALGTGRLLSPGMQRLRLQLLQTGIQFSPLAGTSATIGLPVQYGLGIADAGGMLGHNGQVPGFTTEMWYLPSDRGTVVAFFNSLSSCQTTPQTPAVLADSAFASLAQAAFGPALQRAGLAAPASCSVPGS